MANDIQKLVMDHKRLIEAEAYRYATNIPLTTTQMEAYKLANEAAKNYDAKSGVKFSTYLTSYLKKLSRLNTQYGAIVRVSENKQLKIHKINNAEKDLEATLGRPPSVSELSDATGLPMQAISALMEDKKSTININNLASSPIFFNNSNDEWVHFVYHDLPDRDKVVFEHKIGYAGKPILDNETLAKKLNISNSTLNNRVKAITQRLEEGWKS